MSNANPAISSSVSRGVRKTGCLLFVGTGAGYGYTTQGLPASIRRTVNEVFNLLNHVPAVGGDRIGGAARHAGASGIRFITDAVGHLQKSRCFRDRALLKKF